AKRPASVQGAKFVAGTLPITLKRKLSAKLRRFSMRSLLEVRPFLPIDLPLIRRLAPLGVSFDSMTSLTRGMKTPADAVWSAVPLADLGTPAFVMGQDDRAYVAQFRHKSGAQHAHVTFIAPDLDVYGELAWLQLLDTMTQYAGRRGALTLKAEVAETE